MGKVRFCRGAWPVHTQFPLTELGPWLSLLLTFPPPTQSLASPPPLPWPPPRPGRFHPTAIHSPLLVGLGLCPISHLPASVIPVRSGTISILPPAGARPAHSHADPHLGEWMRDLGCSADRRLHREPPERAYGSCPPQTYRIRILTRAVREDGEAEAL